MTRNRARLSMTIFGALLLVLAVGGACSKKKSTTDTTPTPTTSATAAVSPTATPAGKKHSEMSKEELAQWQKDLNAVGCWAGPLDGTMGPETEHAIKQFQKAEGLAVDGLLGPITENSLKTAAAAGKRVCVPPTVTVTPSGTPPCTIDALSAAARAHHGASFKQMNQFECAGIWATASVGITEPGGGPEVDVTDLYKVSGTQWAWLDRTKPCADGEVPQAIYARACQSN